MLLGGIPCQAQQANKGVFDLLLKTEQGLLDAIADGDKTAWHKQLHDSCLITLENGERVTKKGFIESLTALPKGYVGVIKIIEPEFRLHGNTAVLSFVNDEHLKLYGQEIHTQYSQTDTWICRDGKWEMVAMQLFEIPKNPLPVRIDTAVLKRYAGTYYLSSERTCTVSVEDGKLFVLKGSNKQELLAQTEQVFFRKGDGRVDVIFMKDSNGIYRMIERREGEDLVWNRITGG